MRIVRRPLTTGSTRGRIIPMPFDAIAVDRASVGAGKTEDGGDQVVFLINDLHKFAMSPERARALGDALYCSALEIEAALYPEVGPC